MKIRHKYNAVRTVRDGIKFPSKKEASRYDELCLLIKTGRVVFFLRQPLFDLGGGTTYRADFLVFWADGTASVEDVKGVETKEFKKAKRQVEARYPVKIEVVR
jgi:hypothetical protein